MTHYIYALSGMARVKNIENCQSIHALMDSIEGSLLNQIRCDYGFLNLDGSVVYGVIKLILKLPFLTLKWL